MSDKYYKILVNYIRLIIVLSIIGAIIGYLGSKGYLERKAIALKYCYYYNPVDSTKIQFDDVYICYNKKDAIRTINYYSFLLKLRYDSASKYINMIDLEDRYPIPKNIWIEILKYNDDSTIAEIRAEWQDNYRPFYFKKIGYVPTFLLHDSLPILK